MDQLSLVNTQTVKLCEVYLFFNKVDTVKLLAMLQTNFNPFSFFRYMFGWDLSPVMSKGKWPSKVHRYFKLTLSLLTLMKGYCLEISSENSLQWPINVISSFDHTKQSCNPPTDAAPQFLYSNISVFCLRSL